MVSSDIAKSGFSPGSLFRIPRLAVGIAMLSLALAGPASAQGGGSVLVSPAAPTNSDVIEVEVRGTWRDSCVPEFHGVPQPISSNGSELVVRLDAVIPPDVVCLTVQTNFVAVAEIGPLIVGTYELEVVVGDGPGSNAVPWASRIFSVLGDFGTSGGLVVEPTSPTSTDNVRLLAWGVWRDSCTPRTESVSRDGNQLTVLARSEGFVCTQATEKFALSADFGTLPPDTYDVRLIVDDGNTQQVYGTTTFAVGDGTETVLLSGRFQVTVAWGDFEGNSDVATPVPVLSEDTSPFWFFDRDNWEMLVKALDGCNVNGHYWLFASAATDVAFSISVTDTQTGLVRTYENPLGNPASAITDTQAFPCS